ncbi:MAG: hypothetical protein HND57_02830 [Planctomycetes bacterium]|nr:hypothetical protein [Planctomycetota bacterium]
MRRPKRQALPDSDAPADDAVTNEQDLLGRPDTLGEFEGVCLSIRTLFQGFTEGIVTLDPMLILGSGSNLITDLPATLWADHPAFVLIFGPWFALVWLVGGCMITRSAACEFAIVQFIQWPEALAFSLKRWLPLAGSVFFPVIAVLLGLVALAVGGWLMTLPGLNIVGGVLYGLALFGSFVAALLILLTAIGSGMFVPAVAVESADAPDALARAYSYTKNRPLHLLAYLGIAFLIGLAGYLVVVVVATLTVWFAATGSQWFADVDPVRMTGPVDLYHLLPNLNIEDGSPKTSIVAADLIALWRTVVAGVVAGFAVSFHFCAWTVIYFLMRRATDGQDLDEIWQPGLIGGTVAPERPSAD